MAKVSITCFRDGIDLGLDNLLREIEVESFKANLKNKQDECSHENVQRWGPSYTSKPDSSYRKVDLYHCKDCSLQSDTPIGSYKK